MNNALFTPDSNGIVTTDDLGRIRLWRASTGDPVRTIGNLPEGYSANWAVITPDSKCVVVARYSGQRLRLRGDGRQGGPPPSTRRALRCTPWRSVPTASWSPPAPRTAAS